MKFVVDDLNRVHAPGCANIADGGRQVQPYIVKIETPEAMSQHLLVPDQKSDFGRKVSEGPPKLKACAHCVGQMIRETTDMPINENSAEDLNTLLGLIRNHPQSSFVELVAQLASEAELLFMRNVRAQEEIHHLADQVAELTAHATQVGEELANMKMLYQAASATVLVADAAIVTAEHKVEALEIIHPTEET